MNLKDTYRKMCFDNDFLENYSGNKIRIFTMHNQRLSSFQNLGGYLKR